VVQIRTIIGYGSGKQGTEKVHGSPLGAEDLAKVKEHYGFDPTQVLSIHTAPTPVSSPIFTLP